jgi:hypothetical protein
MSAEDNFRRAFERLKAGQTKVLPIGTPVSQNNVAREAGHEDPSDLKKSRFPGLVTEIQDYVRHNPPERQPSERQRLIKQRQRSRDARKTNSDLKAQRDAAASLLVEANAHIVTLTRKVQDLESRLADHQTTARVLPHAPAKPRATLGTMDEPLQK